MSDSSTVSGTEAVASSANEVAEYAGMYLTFGLGDEIYGVPILKVREIIGLMDFTRVPMSKGFLKGVINLRGKVIPVICLRQRFNMPAVDYTEETCIIVIETDQDQMGVVIDSVAEVVNMKPEALEPPPVFGAEFSTDFILAMGKSAERIFTLLDMDRILDIRDFSASAV